MSTQQRFTLLRKVLKALGLSDARIEELSTTIEEWTADVQTEKASIPIERDILRHLADHFTVTHNPIE